ncbi:MAG: winged helix-turn-helix domain-containing protein [Clostridia bacterium]|nr:winged helix-turn-helix domain-containing protein [Clostridia bacterium]
MNEEAYAKLEKIKLKLYRVFAEELSEHEHKRYNYDELAERLNCSRNAIRYNVGKLLSAGVIGSEGGKLYLKIG